MQKHILKSYFISTILASTLTLPCYANAESANDKSAIYDYAFSSFIEDTQTYYIYAGNLGDLTEYKNQVKLNSVSADNNTFYVESGASISDSSIFANTTYKISGAAAHIAIYGETDSVVSATSNISYMSGGYIANLYGAFISINSLGYYPSNGSYTYTKTTLSSVSASDNAIYLTEGTVGEGVEVDDSGVSSTYDAGNTLAAAFVSSVNTNSNVTFYLDNNSVNISGGTVLDVIGQSLENGALSGAYVSTVLGEATMSNNSVNIEAGDVQADRIFGATFYTKSLISIAENFSKKYETDYQSYIYEDLGFDTSVPTSTSATMFNNVVNISSLDETIYFYTMAGAYASVTNTATLYNNSVNITGGTLETCLSINGVPSNEGFIAGAYALLTTPMGAAEGDNGWNYTYGGTVTASVYGNSVNITGGEIKSIIAGAIVKAESYNNLSLLVDNLNYEAEISNNTVSIYGGTINSITNDNINYSGIYGALYQGSDSSNATSGYGIINTYSITNNTVTIGLDAIIDDDKLSIGGGAYNNNPSIDIEFFTLVPDANAFDGNTFHLDQISEGISASTMANFENYIFTLGTENKAGDVLITLSDTLYLGNGYENEADGTLATKYASITEINVTANNTLVEGDSITLISATSIDGVLANDGGMISSQYGFLDIDWTINQINNEITATYEKLYAGDSSKAVAESSLSNSTLINTGADFISDSIIGSARSNSSKANATSSNTNTSNAISGFASTSGGTSRYNTGSHIDIDSVNFATGVAANFERALLGVFIEAGYGSYDTYNNDVVGSGTSSYYGLGLFAKVELGEIGDFSPYAQASISGGFIDNSYALKTRSASYDNDDDYITSHVGIGVLWECYENVELDINLKYFYSYLYSNQATASTLDTLDFSSVNSHRLRLSASGAYSFNKSIALYVSAGVEQEFDGASNVSVNGYKSESPSLSGTTGIIGLGIKGDIADSGFSYDFNIQGYAGLRDGLSANLGLGYRF